MAGRGGGRGRRRNRPPSPYDGPPHDDASQHGEPGPYGPSGYGGSPYGESAYGGPPQYGEEPYEEAPPDGPPAGRRSRRGGRTRRRSAAPPPETSYDDGPPHGEPGPYGPSGYGGSPYGDSAYGGPPQYGEEPYEEAPPDGPPAGRRSRRGGRTRRRSAASPSETSLDEIPPYGQPQYGGPPPYDEAPPGDDEPPPRRRGSRRAALGPRAYFLAAGALVLAALLVVVAVAAFTGGGGKGPDAAPPKVTGVRSEGPGASAYSQAASTAAFAAIADRTKDPRPLTSAEVFHTKKITDSDAKATLKLTASQLSTRCTGAIWGVRLAGALAQGRCTQVARATYSDHTFAAMVTIFNLADTRGADQVVAQADPRTGGGFPLVPPKSVDFGRSFSTARGVAMGHYAVITWVQRADGSGDESDAALLSLLVTTGRAEAVLIRATGTGRRH